MNVSALWESEACPGDLALVFAGRGAAGRATFAELAAMTQRAAGRLDQAGIGVGIPLLLLAGPSVPLVSVWIAALRLGATIVVPEAPSGLGGLHRTLAAARPLAAVGDRVGLALARLLPAARSVRRWLSLAEVVAADGAQARVPPRVDVPPDHPALVTFTGGSTRADGRPRAVIRGHGVLAAQHEALSGVLPGRHGEVDLTTFPVVLLHNLARGVATVMPDRRSLQVVRLMLEHGVTTASGPPSFWAALARTCETGGLSLPLRRVAVGGAPVHPRLWERLAAVAPGAELVGVYGCTEAEPVAVLRPGERLGAWRGRTASGAGVPLGYAAPGSQVKLVAVGGGEAGPGQTGELWVAGRHVATDAPADASGRAWHRTGDIARMDDDGCLWLRGRVHSRVQRSGGPVDPVPIEAAAECEPWVGRAALAGVGDGERGERAVLAVELASRPPTADWRGHMLAWALSHGWPVDEVRPIRRIPLDRRHGSRIDYRRLRVALA